MNEFLTFIRDEQRKSNVMTSARIQPFCKNHDIIIGFCDGFRVNSRNVTEKNIAFYIVRNNFCLLWKSITISFNEAIEELKLNFKIIDNLISDKHDKNFIKYEYKSKEVQTQLTNMFMIWKLLSLIELFLMRSVCMNLVKY